ncbi:hypothetical protein CONPUDRAFT_89848 [Coniophora puteana RWD-64-598 SS2]|uniref:DNA replication factor Cdt1 C-terminal domain-containing protein n=1 Tax=Coniophora puteana (strain RWD-64-598) TaxID=741705 RepID=A0A5M3MTE0_CONPW|nr:uncharacterized protein CONPUDRAFT_89848 [Coniophora puteana RWD-64-598 SS2]EIW82428.1 hypothetical protein CONPUDRAFT_89848 [Coniophora puteana RWD-64-598 SS2]
MADLYSSLNVSPKKKRALSPEDETVITPKRVRAAPPTPPPTKHKGTYSKPPALPSHLSRLLSFHSAIQQSLSHALATCAVSPSESGIVRNVLNNISITTYSGFSSKFEPDDLKRLCWLWEWDGKTFPSAQHASPPDDEENPFLDSKPSSNDWTRGSMGLVVTPTSHFSKSVGKRVPVYGIGIEVQMDIDKDMPGGMAAVARWTADSEKRWIQFKSKLESWVKHFSDTSPLPYIPLADLPELKAPHKASALTRVLATASPKGMAALSGMVPAEPSSPSRSPRKKLRSDDNSAVPSPTKARLSQTNIIAFPKTPTTQRILPKEENGLLTPKTPARTRDDSDVSVSGVSTPVHQRGPEAETAPKTPSTSRRQALYERIRHKSLTSTPSKPKSSEVPGSKLTREQIQKLGQDEIRRRCLLGRLGGVAESIWMQTTRKRKALPYSEVAAKIIKSSPVPMSISEAAESIKLLTTLCPFFLRTLDIKGEDWLEMPQMNSSQSETAAAETSRNLMLPAPPHSPKGLSIPVKLPDPSSPAEESLLKSPRRVKREAGGLREVREIIRRELEIHD